MNEKYWFIFIAVVMYAMVMTRLDRLGKQIETTFTLIRHEVARTEGERDEILDDWKKTQQDAKKDAGRFWIFWGFIGVAALSWYAATHTIF